MVSNIKTLITPKKLWILRLYVALLTYLVEILLVIYVLLSLYNLLAQDNAFGDLILGYAGLYLVWICLAILFVAQVVSLFLNIHDNIEDVRNKAIDPDFSIDVASEREKNKESSISSVVMIITIILAIILSFVNLNRQNVSTENTYQEDLSTNSDKNLLNINDALGNIFNNWSFLSDFKSAAHFKDSQLNEVCDDSYCVSFTQIENLLITSYSTKETIEAETKVYNTDNNSIVLEGKFYVEELDLNNQMLNISDQGYDNGRFFREGTLNLVSLSVNWGEKQY